MCLPASLNQDVPHKHEQRLITQVILSQPLFQIHVLKRKMGGGIIKLSFGAQGNHQRVLQKETANRESKEGPFLPKTFRVNLTMSFLSQCP